MSKKIRNIIIYAVLIIIAVGLVYLASNFGCASVSENSPATANIKPGDNVTFNQMACTADCISEIPYGSILIYKSPKTTNEFFVSRLIGKQGDLLQLKNGQLYRNRKLVEEKYIRVKSSLNSPELLIPKDYVYLLSDERIIRAADSYVFGPVSVSDIIGLIPE